MSSNQCTAPSKYTTKSVGTPATINHRLFIVDAATNKPVSPFHDIPLWADRQAGILNMVVEIPRWSNAKMEICKDEPSNPIKQDVKKGALRYVRNCFPHHGYPWNYGALPQTWESPEVADKATGLKGDNDPLDAVEIASREPALPGTVKQVKVLGAMALLDEGETDWKILVVDVTDPLAAKLNDANDLLTATPGLVDATRHWFRSYKVPDGKPLNEFAFEGRVMDRAFAMRVVEETHELWRALHEGHVPSSKEKSYTISLMSHSGDVSAMEAVSEATLLAINAPAPADLFYV